MDTITVVEVKDITLYPPVQNLIKILLDLGYSINLIGTNLDNISEDISSVQNCNLVELGKFQSKLFISRWIHKIFLFRTVRKKVKYYMRDSEYLWTTSDSSIIAIKKLALNYKNIFQLMELTEYGVMLNGKIKIRFDKIAQKSWKTVVPEINRAYIQKAWWNLSKPSYVLPNKPYSLDYGKIDAELEVAINIMKNENRKIILYLGGLHSDRNFETYAKAISKMDGYVLYIVGKAFSGDPSVLINKLTNDYGAVYLGFFKPPKHLALVNNAHIGLLPYMTAKTVSTSVLNALYCAPNKIWEYAGFGVPMVGSDVLGLKLPFEQWNIGRCCDLNDEDSIIKAIEEVDKNHDEMSKNCYKFYDSVDLEKIVSEILEDEN